VRAAGLILVLLAVLTADARAGGPTMMVGAAEDVVKAPDYATAKLEVDKLRLAGLDTIRLTQTWTRGQTAADPDDDAELGNAIQAAEFSGVRVILSIYPFGSSVTPLTDADRADFATFAADVVRQYPAVRDVIVGNEPNLNRFWMPQFDDAGGDAAAPAYEALLAQTYDALKHARADVTVYGGALAPRGTDRPGTGRDTHSPTAFIADLGAAYRASGRTTPIMDGFAFHPYPEASSAGPSVRHPGTSIGLADYPKLVALLGDAFDGTAQPGSTLPVLYDEFGIESRVPPRKAALYRGAEPTTTRPVAEATQARFYARAMQMAFCQPTVTGLLLFHVQDEPALPAWQSGEFYVDGTPKSSLPAVRDAARRVHRGIVAACPGLELTPKVVLKVRKPDKRGVKVLLTCSLDCFYTAALDRRHLAGTATGAQPLTLVFTGRLRPGRHSLRVEATAVVNPGPPGSASSSFRSS
jgi:hypothetical protein